MVERRSNQAQLGGIHSGRAHINMMRLGASPRLRRAPHLLGGSLYTWAGIHLIV
jgi:hypothetical protein